MASSFIPPDEPIRQRRARPWRIVTIVGGLLLLVSFFLPTGFFLVWGPGSTGSAASQLGELLKQLLLASDSRSWPADVFETLLGIDLLLSLFLPGALVSVAAALRLNRRYGWLHARPWSIAGILVVTWLAPGACIFFEGINEVSPGEPEAIVMLAIIFILFSAPLAYLIRAWLRPPHRVHLSVAFEVAVLTLLSYAFLVVFGSFPLGSTPGVLPGECVALIGVAGLLIGTVGEAKALTRRSWWGTVWRLILCCLKDAPGKEDRCPQCDYRLFGLSEMRCPECGRPFTFEELGISPADLGFRTTGHSRPPSH